MGPPSALRPRAFWRRAEAFAQAGRIVFPAARDLPLGFNLQL
jgi:hypothetical protein